MYALSRNFVKQGGRRWSSTAARSLSERPIAATACALLAVASVAAAPAACDGDKSKVSMEKLTAEWDTFMHDSCRLGEDDDDDDDDEEEEEDEEEADEESDENTTEVEEDTKAEIQQDIQAWLKEQMVSSEAYSAEELLAHFLSEMALGLEGGDNGSSLAMIPAYVNIHDSVPANTPVAVIDAGGSNLRICLASFDQNGNITLTNTKKQDMPGKDEHVTPREFYNTLVDALEPMKDDFDAIGFCFSYPAEINEDLDGKLLKWTKEIKIPELIDTYIGKGLLDALKERGIEDKRVVILNDTVACLLAGLSQGQQFNASSYIGFILGTGTNTAYVESNENIRKLDIDQGSQVINVESGGFEKFPRGTYDLELDIQSENPGGHQFEKVISGAYMGNLTLKLLHALSDRGLFSEQGSETLSNMKELRNMHVSNLVANNGEETDLLGTEAFTDADREIIKEVYGAVVDRAALLTAVNICAAVIKSGKGKDADSPVCVNIDGSTYQKTFQMEEKVQGYLQEMLKERGLFVECVQVKDAPAVGAAIAGLGVAN